MTRIKICGIREPAHALAAAEAGADYIGMILAPSRRQITVEQAAKIVAAVKGSSKTPPKMVGVFVNAPTVAVNYAAITAALDMVQLSGQEDEDYLAEIEAPKIKTVHIKKNLPDPVAMMSLRRSLASLKAAGVLPQLDSQGEGQGGGTGQTFDWSVAQKEGAGYDYMLAGGLTPENVAAAIGQLHPWAVDVSGGVETAGVKDAAKIRAFIQAVRAAK